ncbi:MAG: TetR/AcrR family transcriptional regulator [Coprobacillus sp.]
MNEAFLTLPVEKQERIINAALEVFSKHDYKKANTDDIAAIAGISKGSLFYYFKNKEGLFMYLFDYVVNLVSEYVKINDYLEITDFFELMDYGAKRKIVMIEKNPYIFEFTMKCFLQEDGPVSQQLRETISNLMKSTYGTYFSHIDTSKFKDGINFKDVYDILAYATEGYVQALRSNHQSINIDSMMKEFYRWSVLFKKMAYKEEFLDE